MSLYLSQLAFYQLGPASGWACAHSATQSGTPVPVVITRCSIILVYLYLIFLITLRFCKYRVLEVAEALGVLQLHCTQAPIYIFPEIYFCWCQHLVVSGVPRGDAQDARASPLPPCASPPRPCASPPSPAWKAGYEKRWGNGQQEKNASLFTYDLIIFCRTTWKCCGSVYISYRSGSNLWPQYG